MFETLLNSLLATALTFCLVGCDVDAPEMDVKMEEKTVTVPDVDVDLEEKTIKTPDVDITPPTDE